MKVGYLGAPGSFSYQAAKAYFPKVNDFVGLSSFADIFKGTAEGSVEAALVPVENSIAGIIYGNYDLLEQSKTHVIGEQYVRVEHYLLAQQGQDVSTIRKVYSHPKALEQCKDFLDRHPHIQAYPVSDTTAAVKHVQQEGRQSRSAAIAAKECAALYNLHIVASELEDSKQNYTRFLVISNKAAESVAAQKCSLAVSLPHTPGSLATFLAQLAQGGCNLTQIVSRPIHGKPFEYRFYIDFTADNPLTIVNDISKQADVRLLGVYAAKSISV